MTHDIKYVPPNEQMLEALLILIKSHAALVEQMRIAASPVCFATLPPVGKGVSEW
jgi:hypothetical protein